MKIPWAKLKDIAWALSLVGVIITWRVDKARTQAVVETNMANLMIKVEDANKKLDRHETYWNNQNEINGRVVTYIELDSRGH
jgi:uncharacterized membrane protein